MTRSQPIIITDLDGTLLDQETYSYEACLPAIRKLLSLDLPLILCSSKTSSEIVPLWQELSLKDPFIVENGGAIYFPTGYFPFPIQGIKHKGSFEALELGTNVSTLRQVLAETASQFGVRVRSFGTMDLDEISALTGLKRDQSFRAMQREYDEPFLVEEGDPEKLFAALGAKGLTLTHGGRFFHLSGRHDKGKAVRILLDLYRRGEASIFSVALGNSVNDLPLFGQIDRPILIRNHNGSYDPDVVKGMPQIERTESIGPHGWREAIERILAGERR